MVITNSEFISYLQIKRMSVPEKLETDTTTSAKHLEDKPYKQIKDFNSRHAEAKRMRDKYPDRIPIIIDRAPNKQTPIIDKRKYLVRGKFTVAEMMITIQKRLKVDETTMICLLINNKTLLPGPWLMSSAYKEHKDADGFLYITYSFESAYG